MNIILVTPAAHRSRAGNRATATRWARLLRGLGHRVRVRVEDDGRPADLMIALHAWRNAAAVRTYRARAPRGPLIVALTGTDIYRFQHSDPEPTLASMAAADALVGLHERVADDIPARFHGRLHTVFQSAPPVRRRLPPIQSRFDICVAGHLREEKDPLRAAEAVRDLPAQSRLRVIHVGRAHDADWDAAARAEMEHNPRFRWRGEIPHGEVRRLMARSRAMVISSIMEGGANVVSEACVAGLPVIASDIPGNRGLLGDDHPACFPVGDTGALRALLLDIEAHPDRLEALAARSRTRAERFTPEAEQAALGRAVDAATGDSAHAEQPSSQGEGARHAGS